MTKLGLSPCPNDTFIFHALLEGLVKPDFREPVRLAPVFADVQELNERALHGELPFTKLSAGAIPAVLDKYRLLETGAALGWGCGPLVVARSSNFNPARARIAIPGRHTTASMLLDLHGGFRGERPEMLFSDIMPAVASGEADLGVIIHEGRFTYPQYGLAKILDLGEWWEEQYGIPLPLGVIAVRRDVEPALARAVENAIAASIRHARQNPGDSRAFIRAHAQELDDEITGAHIDTFVTDFSLGLGETGKAAIRQLLKASRLPAKDIFLSDTLP